MNWPHCLSLLVLTYGLVACGGDTTPAATGPGPDDAQTVDDSTTMDTDINLTPPEVGSDLADATVCIDEDGDGFGEGCADGFDCNDGARHIHEGAEELCDNIDNDCDDTIDEDCPCEEGSVQPCYTGPAGTLGVGRCLGGWQVCEDEDWGDCEAEFRPTDEICDGIDNNCDGQVDEELVNGCGLCGSTPDEVCLDGLDNDCDGTIDESAEGCDCDDRTQQSCYSGPPHTLGVGPCRGGITDCEGEDWGLCDGEVLPSVEICDGIDNDCDGLADEGLINRCGVCGEPTPREVCDHVDNDCDGLIDEGLVLVCGECAAEGLEEECGDGADNNCDGTVDEGCACVGEVGCYPGPADVRGIGACVEGTRECDGSGEFWGDCFDYGLPQPETCDGIDNDCDGSIDISPLGCNLCDRLVEECDGLDNDCDGYVDEFLRNTCGQCLADITPEEDCGDDCCDGIDNDCDGLIDELLTNACGTCGDTCYSVLNEPSDDDDVGEGGLLIPADDPDNPTGRAGITLAKTSFLPPYLWAANHGDNTVSRFNTTTMREEGRYWVGVNPSRTAVDLDGNVWIAGRGHRNAGTGRDEGGGQLTKILWDPTSCEDRDGSEAIETSGPDNLGPLNSAEDPLADECVVFSQVTHAERPSTRGIAAGPDGRLWIGYTDGGVQSIDPHTFELSPFYDSAAVPMYAPDEAGVQRPQMSGETQLTMSQGGVYGLVVDSRGMLYTSSYDRDTLARFDTNTNEWDAIFTQYVCGSYGIAVDGQNRVWTGGWPGCRGIGMFDPEAMAFNYFAVPSGITMTPGGESGIDPNPAAGCGTPGYCVTGVGVEPATGDVWASFYAVGYTGRLSLDEDNLGNSRWRFIGTTRDADGNFLSGVGNDLRGVGFDGNGFAWTLGLGSDRVWKIDPATEERSADAPLGVSIGVGSHYTYSDFTGSTALSFTAPRTLWRYVFDSSYPNAQIDFVEWEAYVPEDTSAGLRIRALDEAGDPLGEWIPAPDGTGAQYDPYPTDADSDVLDLRPGGLAGHQFEIEVRLSTSDPEIQPIVHSVELHWQRP